MSTASAPAVRDLDGKVAIVTGGARGIGRAIAADLAASGARVVVADLEGAEETAAELAGDGLEVVGVTSDVSSEADVAALAEAAVSSAGGVDILVNNAGLFGTLTPGPLDRITTATWQRVMDVNVLGAFLCTRAVLPSMRERGGGRIVNIASTTAFKGVPFLLHYVASKGALLAMTKAAARELGADGIQVNAVAPGFTISDGVAGNSADMARMRAGAPGQRALARESLPEDIVGAVHFLSGPSSAFVTGQTIVVDGGAYLH